MELIEKRDPAVQLRGQRDQGLNGALSLRKGWAGCSAALWGQQRPEQDRVGTHPKISDSCLFCVHRRRRRGKPGRSRPSGSMKSI